MNDSARVQLPHHRLREQATRAAKGAALNCAEAANRSSAKDKARVFGIARGEAGEAAAAVEIAAMLGAVPAASMHQVNALAQRLIAMLTRLCR